MKKALPFLLLALLTFSCKEKNVSKNVEVCGVKDPIRNLPWLRDLVEKAKANKEDSAMTISLVELRGEPVINYTLSYMSCIGCHNFHCDGSRVDMSSYTETEIQEFQKNIWDEKGKRIVLWPEK
ncbi:hypothetical protein [Dyadobacter sp. Leaf189]|uniref:hypothetical protein n=1 Tax=Dyadobacter sp. Leaf189 TaxID=1736295 RepID=UPI0007008120|nr:hypothetical protein [Dyadobacter sp. Leaf189]KQS34078.1 hypothetical protein ASG33_08670 [Dyadobacter sp. Leaf189]